MRIIVSTELKDVYQNFVVKAELKEVKDLVTSGSVQLDALIIHKPKESDFNAGVFLSDLYKTGLKNLIYIAKTFSTVLRMAVLGAGGFCCEGDFYFDDESELMELLNSCEEDAKGETSLTEVSLGIVERFIGDFVRGESRINTSLYLDQVQQALSVLTTTIAQQQTQITAMGTSALQVFEQASSIIRKMAENTQQVAKASEKLMSSTSSSSSPMSNMISSFPPVPYTKSATMLVIRELTPCRYLTSFLLGYHHHLRYDLNKRVKLIFLHTKAYCTTKVYDGVATSITLEGVASKSLYDAEIVATSVPTKAVISQLTEGHNDIIIVVDRMYQKPIMITGRIKATLFAMGGVGDLNKYKVDAKDSIISVVAHPHGMISLPTITNFPIEADARMSQILQANIDNFSKLDKRIGLQQ